MKAPTLQLLTRAGAARTIVLALVVLAGAVMLVPGRAEAATVHITVTDTYYCSPSYYFGVCPTTINTGDTVTWDFSGTYHTTTECGGMSCVDPAPPSPVFDSGIVFGTGTYSFTFNTPGTYLYQCGIHGAAMRGQITVAAAVGGVAELSQVQFAPVDSAAQTAGSPSAPTLLAGGAALVLGAIVSIAWYAGKRRVSKFD
ncbi:MAG: plastocyanin/azurin family copper-binding protein [Dehalococcoidia bacterium]